MYHHFQKPEPRVSANMYHHFKKVEPNVGTNMYHHFKKAEPKKTTKRDEEDIDDLESIEQKLKVMGIMSSSSKVQIENLVQLRQRVSKIRSGWFADESKRQGNGYVPSEHDKIKFNINLYLGQTFQYFVKDIRDATAVVLDSDDLGTSATLKAFNFNTKNIYVPNYFDRYTDYTIIKKRVRDLGCFPVGLEQFFRAWGDSKTDQEFQENLIGTYEVARYRVKPDLIDPLPTRFEHLDFAYLDYCNMFETKDKTTGKSNKDTVNYMFEKHMFPTEKPYVLAITGSLMFFENAKLNSTLERYKNAVLSSARLNGYEHIREDQFFVYNRSHQQGEVEEVIAHRDSEDIPNDIKHKEVTHSSKMFFMSFVGGASVYKLAQWDSLFKICDGGQCKLQFGHRECLYQRGKDRLHLSKPFCNYRITEFYFADPGKKKLRDFIAKFQDVPMVKTKEVVDGAVEFYKAVDEALTYYNTRSRLPEGIRKSFKEGADIIDITQLINIVNDARKDGGMSVEHEGVSLHLDETFYITGFIASGTVSVECILGKIVGIHFTNSDNIKVPGIKCSSKPKPNISTSCFLIHIEDLVKIITKEPNKLSKAEHKEESTHKFKVGDRVMFVGDDIKNTPGIYETVGTVVDIDYSFSFPQSYFVEWDDGEEQGEDEDDLKLVGPDEELTKEDDEHKEAEPPKKERYPKRHRHTVDYEEKEEQSGYQEGDLITVDGREATVQKRRGKTVYYTYDDTGEKGKLKL